MYLRAGLLLLLSAIPLRCQNSVPNSVPSDLQAVQIGEACIAASGGRAAIQSLRDIRESGTITYNWGLEPLKGSASIAVLPGSSIRFDASLPDQERSWYVERGQGKSRLNGKTSKIPFHAGASRLDLTLPFVPLLQALSHSAYRVSYLGAETHEDHDVYRLRVELMPANDDEKQIARLLTTEYLIDSKSYLILRIEDLAHPPESMDINQRHALDYADYRNVDGIQVPFSVVEHVENAQTWSLQFEDVTANAGLSPSDIKF